MKKTKGRNAEREVNASKKEKLTFRLADNTFLARRNTNVFLK